MNEFIAQATELSRQLPDSPYVINLSVNRFEFMLAFWAAVIAGQCTLMPPNRQRRTVQQLADDYPGCYVIGDIELDGIGRFDGDLRMTGAVGEAPVPSIADDQLCAIVFTSGSTGASMPNPKYWRTLRGGTLSNVALLVKPGGPPMNVIATVPPQHMWGFETSILLPMFAEIAVSDVSPFFPQDIHDALAAMPEARALVSSPVHLDALLKANVEPVEIARIFSATAPLSAELASALEESFHAEVIDVFGCSESGIIAKRSVAREVLWTLSPRFELNVDDSAATVRADHLPVDVVLSDVVETVGDGKFRWLGRHQDMVNIAGKRGSLADLNHRLVSIPGVTDGVIFMPDDDKRLAALVVAPDMSPSDILEQLRHSTEPAFLPRPLYIVPALPRQETGKLPRKEVVELFEAIRNGRQR